MKIMLTANTSWNLAHFRLPLITGLLADGHEIIALSPNDDRVPQLEEMGVRHIPLDMDNKGTGPVKDLQLISEFKRQFKKESPDFVLSFTIKNNIYGAIAARSQGIRFLPNVSGLGTAFLGAGWLEKVVTILYRKAFRPLPRVLFQNTDDRDVFLNHRIITPNQALLVPGSGIDLDHYQPAPLANVEDGALTFLLIGRVLKDKGVYEYVDAARALHATHPNLRFQILGKTDVENRTAISRSTLDGWVSEGVVEYLGSTDDVRPFIENADCVVLPSYREGTPRTLLEAAATGRPLVATDVPGCREVVVHELNGFLCKKQSASDLAAAMLRIVDAGSEARTQLGSNGRAKVAAEFDQAIVVDTYRTEICRIV